MLLNARGSLHYGVEHHVLSLRKDKQQEENSFFTDAKVFYVPVCSFV